MRGPARPRNQWTWRRQWRTCSATISWRGTRWKLDRECEDPHVPGTYEPGEWQHWNSPCERDSTYLGRIQSAGHKPLDQGSRLGPQVLDPYPVFVLDGAQFHAQKRAANTAGLVACQPVLDPSPDTVNDLCPGLCLDDLVGTRKTLMLELLLINGILLLINGMLFDTNGGELPTNRKWLKNPS